LAGKGMHTRARKKTRMRGLHATSIGCCKATHAPGVSTLMVAGGDGGGMVMRVFTAAADLERAHRVAAKLDAGTTWINEYNLGMWKLCAANVQVVGGACACRGGVCVCTRAHAHATFRVRGLDLFRSGRQAADVFSEWLCACVVRVHGGRHQWSMGVVCRGVKAKICAGSAGGASVWGPQGIRPRQRERARGDPILFTGAPSSLMLLTALPPRPANIAALSFDAAR